MVFLEYYLEYNTNILEIFLKYSKNMEYSRNIQWNIPDMDLYSKFSKNIPFNILRIFEEYF